ncbi:MAG: amidohydrolase family protein [Candidatus Eisenbacteria bacterium]|nr:amidohydrolase family protein [Candidatus Eisenbacteria bacterium]
MSSTLIHSGTLVCMDAAGTVARGDLLVRGDAIAAISAAVPDAIATLPDRRADESIDASGCFVLPGLVHGHLHLCQTLFRGLAEQADLLGWLRERIWPLEAAHTEASIAASARLGLAELIAGGVTCVNDMGTVRHTDVIGETLAESGIRALFGKALMDRGDGVPQGLIERPRDALEDALALAKRFGGSAGGRLRVSLAPRFILSCSEALWKEVRDASLERDLVIHTHLSESPTEGREVEAAVRSSAARFFEAREVLSTRFVGAHGVWLEDDELALLRRADAALVHCPGSNLKLGSGFARVSAWRRSGLRIGLGSDGAACNNRLDTFHEMSLAAGVSRALDHDAALSAREVLALATCGGAAALGLGAVTGSLEAGKQADLIVLDASAPHHAPNAAADPYATVVHAARASDVLLTMAAGHVLYRDGAWTTLDGARAIADARAEALGLVRRAAVAG